MVAHLVFLAAFRAAVCRHAVSSGGASCAVGCTWFSVLLMGRGGGGGGGIFGVGQDERGGGAAGAGAAQVPVLLGEGLLLHSCNNKYKQRMIQALHNSWQSQDKAVAQV